MQKDFNRLCTHPVHNHNLLGYLRDWSKRVSPSIYALLYMLVTQSSFYTRNLALAFHSSTLKLVMRTPKNRIFPFISSTRIRFIRSHRPHAAASKYRGFREVVLVCVHYLANIGLTINRPYHTNFDTCGKSRAHYRRQFHRQQ